MENEKALMLLNLEKLYDVYTHIWQLIQFTFTYMYPGKRA